MSALERLRELYAALPEGGSVVLTRDALARLLEAGDVEADEAAARSVEPAAAPQSWRERLWAVPADTRIGVAELCEATGRSRDWVYRAKDPKWAERRGSRPLPYARLDGVLTFRVGDVRAWLQEHEERFHGGGAGPGGLRAV